LEVLDCFFDEVTQITPNGEDLSFRNAPVREEMITLDRQTIW